MKKFLMMTFVAAVCAATVNASASENSKCFDLSSQDFITSDVALSINGDEYVVSQFACGQSSTKVSYYLPKTSECPKLITIGGATGKPTQLWKDSADKGIRLLAVSDTKNVGSIGEMSDVQIGISGIEPKPLISLFRFERKLIPLSINYETLKVENKEVGLSDFQDGYHRKYEAYRYTTCTLLR